MTQPEFTLHPQLEKDTLTLGQFPLSQLLLMNDRQFPWFILVPRVVGVREIYQLSLKDQQQLLKESSLLGQTLMELYQGDKLNVAALGNLVPQLHLHHIVRFKTDPCWPAPIWGKLPVVSYTEQTRVEVSQRLVEKLSKFDFKQA